jgi:ketosteroid isomerase-like protein
LAPNNEKSVDVIFETSSAPEKQKKRSAAIPILITWFSFAPWIYLAYGDSSFGHPLISKVIIVLVAVGLGIALTSEQDVSWIVSRRLWLVSFEVEAERVLYSLAPCLVATLIAGLLSSEFRATKHIFVGATMAVIIVVACGLANYFRVERLGAQRNESGYLLQWPEMVACGVGMGSVVVLTGSDSKELAILGLVFATLVTLEKRPIRSRYCDHVAVFVSFPLGFLATSMGLAFFRADRLGPTSNPKWIDSLLGWINSTLESHGVDLKAGAGAAYGLVAAFVAVIMVELVTVALFKSLGRPVPTVARDPRLKYQRGKPEAEVEEVQYQLIDSLRDNDRLVLSALLCPKYLLAGQEATVIGSSDTSLDQVIKASVESGSVSISDVLIHSEGSTAVALSKCHPEPAQGSSKTEKSTASARLDVWVKKGEGWRLSATQFVNDPAPTSGPRECQPVADHDADPATDPI